MCVQGSDHGTQSRSQFVEPRGAPETRAELSSELVVVRVGRTAEILTADGTAAYRAYSAVQDPQLLLLHLVEQAVDRWRKERASQGLPERTGTGRRRRAAHTDCVLPRPVVDGVLQLKCTVPSGFPGIPRSIVLRVHPNLNLTVHDAQDARFLGSGELTEDGIAWSPCPMALSELAREMLDLYAEGVGRVFGDGLIKVQDWTNERRARLLFGLPGGAM